MSRKKKFILFAIFLVISLFVLLYSSTVGEFIGIFLGYFSYNTLLLKAMFIILFIALTTFAFSVSIMTGFGALFFPANESIFYSIIGILGSSIIIFFVARRLGRDYVRNYVEKKGGKLEKFDKIIEHNTFKTILILSAIFFVNPMIPNLLGGIIKINFRNYIIATFIGNLPNTIFTVLLVKGVVYSNIVYVYISSIGLISVTLIALYFYKGELIDIIELSLPRRYHKYFYV